MKEQIFDSQRFLQSLADDMELARELLAAFLEDSPERNQSLAEALQAGDTDTASRLAHSLKGMCGVVRAEQLVNLALNMEQAAKNGNLEKTKTLYGDFDKKLSKAHEEIHVFIED